MSSKAGFLRNFLIGVGLAGCTCLVIGIWLHQQLKLNPLSEIVEIDGAKVEIDWKPVEWEPGLSGVWLNNHKIEPAGGWSGNGNVPFRQWLVTVSYANHFGDISFKSQAGLWGTTTEDWSSYVLHPIRMGGGTTDGATHFFFEYRLSSKELKLTMTQYLNPARLAKVATVKFAWIDGKFQLADKLALAQ